jgi:membrane-associated phospholipid phosphatase
MDGKERSKPAKPQYSIWLKPIVLPAIVAFYTVGYLYLNSTTIHSPKFYDVAFAFERSIPFFPQLVWSYSFVYLLVIILFLEINSDPLLITAAKAFILNSMIHFGFFYFMPVMMTDRPVLIPNGDFWNDYAAFWFWLDNPTTLFPSAHVSMSFLSAYIVLQVNRRLGIFCLLVAAYVGVSVVLIKQHYIADVMAGFLLASFNYALFFYILPHRQNYWDAAKTRLNGLMPSFRMQ